MLKHIIFKFLNKIMNLPFTPEQFFGVFERYNNTVWPAQILIYVTATAAVLLVFKTGKYSSKIIVGILAVFWLWMGIFYHWAFFTSINPAARIFGTFFVLEGLILVYSGVIKNNIEFEFKKDWRSYAGLTLAVFGPVIYPILGYFVGHSFPSSPTFGLPCPTTIFTFGLLLLTRRMPKYVIIIPFLWSIVGFSAAISLRVKEDISLLVAGLVGTGALIFRKKRITQSVQEVTP